LPIVPITLVPLLERPIGSRTPIGKSAALPLLPGGEASAIIAALTLGVEGRPVAERLRGVRRGARLRLEARLWLLKGVLPLGRRSETIRQGAAEIAIVIQLVAFLSGRTLLAALCKRLRGLGGGNKPEVMFGMLQIILRRDGISPGVGVSRELEIFLGDMMRVAAYFDIRAIRFVGTRQRIGAPPIVCRPAAHPFVLTWSHFDFPTFIPLSPGLSRRFGAWLARIWRETAIHFRVTRMG
jgi:hypothetical protein